MIYHFFLILDENLSLVWGNVYIIVVILHIQIQDEDRIHGWVVLLVHIREEGLKPPGNVNWSAVEEEKILIFANFRRVHASTYDGLGDIASDFDFRAVSFELNKLLEFGLPNNCQDIFSQSFF